jgi:hypothetical protein
MRRRGLLLVATLASVAAFVLFVAPRDGAGDAADIPPEIAAASLSIKTNFVRGVHAAIDPHTIRISAVERLGARSYIVYLEVPDAGQVRHGAVYGLCTEPEDLGDAGGYIDGSQDPELVAQREAAATVVCPG